MPSSAQPAANPPAVHDDLERIVHAAITDDSLELPAPPHIAAEIMRLTRGDAAGEDMGHSSSQELAALIQRDLALAGQVMRVANSALYARRSPVVTLPQAIAWLGIREVRNIAFAVAVQSQVFSSTYFRQEMNELWRESVITALFAQEIARLKRRNVESAYLCGLLHRAGMAVILSRVGSAVLKHRITADAKVVIQLAERHEARVGTHLAIAWTLPPVVSAAISHWRNPPQAEMSKIEVMEVALARQISDEMRTPGAGGELPDSMLGPVSKWMDELSIYPDELFTIMAQRAAIYATAESFT
jgi:HD-like signal output (HDOD) protein